MHNGDLKILEALSPLVWKSGLELVHDGASTRGIVYVHLSRLEDMGLVMSRIRWLTPEELVRRGRVPQREFLLTEDGRHRRTEQSAGAAMRCSFLAEPECAGD